MSANYIRRLMIYNVPAMMQRNCRGIPPGMRAPPTAIPEALTQRACGKW